MFAQHLPLALLLSSRQRGDPPLPRSSSRPPALPRASFLPHGSSRSESSGTALLMGILNEAFSLFMESSR